MTTNQTPSGVKLLELPPPLEEAMWRLCDNNANQAEARSLLRFHIKEYALACVEADRKEQADENARALNDAWVSAHGYRVRGRLLSK